MMEALQNRLTDILLRAGAKDSTHAGRLVAEILALPEIKEALEAKARVTELEQEADALWHEMKYPRD